VYAPETDYKEKLGPGPIATKTGGIGKGMGSPARNSNFSNHLQKGVDIKVEMGLVDVLEQKYQQVSQKLDQAEMTASQAKFKCDIATKEKQKIEMNMLELQR